MAPSLGLMSGSSSSIEITIFSILFIAVYITLYTLCINCFSSSQSPETPNYLEEKEIPSSIPSKEKPKDQWSINRTSGNEQALSSVAQNSVPHVPESLHTRSHTMVPSQLPKVYSHNRAESHGYFSNNVMPRLPDIPVFSVRSESSVYPKFPNPNLLPSSFYQSIEAALQPASRQQSETVIKDHDIQDKQDQSDTSNIFTDHTYSLPVLEVSEEHTYESIGMVSVSEPSPPSPASEAAGDQSHSESPYQTLRESEGPVAGNSSTSLTLMEGGQKVKPGLLFQGLLDVQDGQGLPDIEKMAVYAAVNRKNKTVKLQEFPIPSSTIVLDEDDGTEEAAPPVPEKMFE